MNVRTQEYIGVHMKRGVEQIPKLLQTVQRLPIRPLYHRAPGDTGPCVPVPHRLHVSGELVEYSARLGVSLRTVLCCMSVMCHFCVKQSCVKRVLRYASLRYANSVYMFKSHGFTYVHLNRRIT